VSRLGFLSLGCAKNLVDSEVMLGLLRREGHVHGLGGVAAYQVSAWGGEQTGVLTPCYGQNVYLGDGWKFTPYPKPSSGGSFPFRNGGR
jgi:hypothetical protein